MENLPLSWSNTASLPFNPFLVNVPIWSNGLVVRLALTGNCLMWDTEFKLFKNHVDLVNFTNVKLNKLHKLNLLLFDIPLWHKVWSDGSCGTSWFHND